MVGLGGEGSYRLTGRVSVLQNEEFGRLVAQQVNVLNTTEM